MDKTFQNPILSGFYPDPSICRVGEDYYLVCSSFSYFPGLPVFHSKDLLHWEQLGHAIDRAGQIDYSRSAFSEGLWAPTIRHYDGLFYIVNTLVSEGREGVRRNYVLTAKNPAGPWSDPIFIEGADGIDPSLFFDEDGKIWYCGNFINKPKQYEGHHSIYLVELDDENFQMKGERKVIWDGLASRSKWIEAPHIYKKDGWYYLMVAEGGTFVNHAVMMARSRDISGPYEICPRNPILSHRHLSPMHPISVLGHGDLIETQNGEWWMVLLGVRPYEGVQFNLGRETFLVPIVWGEDGWPYVDNESGLVQERERLPDLPCQTWPVPLLGGHFYSDKLAMHWNSIRVPEKEFYSLKDRRGYLRLSLLPTTITDDLRSPAFIGRRQQHDYFTASTRMEFLPEKAGEQAGLCMIQSNEFNYLYVVEMIEDSIYLSLIRHQNMATLHNGSFESHEIAREKIVETPLISFHGQVYLYIQGERETYNLYYGFGENEMIPFKTGLDASLLSTNRAGGFVGAYIGLYASANGQESENVADFDWFDYIPRT